VTLIRYANSAETVELGDHVTYRSMLFWWKWKPGRVSYIPGVSPRHPEMEHDGLTWVGIAGADGTYHPILVEPDSSLLQKTVRFTRRTDGGTLLTPDQIPAEDW
jgi:hypothetical protein